MDAFKMLGVSAVVILFTASMLGGGATRIVVPEQAVGDAVVEALDGARSPAMSGFTPTAMETGAAHAAAGSSQRMILDDVEQTRLAPYIALHRGQVASAPEQLPTGGL